LQVAEGLPGAHKAEILALCDEVDILSRQLGDLCRAGQGNSEHAQAIARNLSQKLYELKTRIQNAVVNRVVEDFIDVNTPLKLFTDAVLAPEGILILLHIICKSTQTFPFFVDDFFQIIRQL
jgi:vinculin